MIITSDKGQYVSKLFSVNTSFKYNMKINKINYIYQTSDSMVKKYDFVLIYFIGYFTLIIKCIINIISRKLLSNGKQYYVIYLY